MSKQSLWPIVLEQCMYDICSNLVQPLCNPNEGGGRGERGELCMITSVSLICK